MSDAQHAYIRGAKRAAFSLVWILTPVLFLLYFSGFSKIHFGWIFILWFFSLFRYSLVIRKEGIKRTRGWPESGNASSGEGTKIVLIVLGVMILDYVGSESIGKIFEGLAIRNAESLKTGGEKLVEEAKAFFAEDGLYRNPPMWLPIVFAALTACVWATCQSVYSKKIPVQQPPPDSSVNKPQGQSPTRNVEDDVLLDATDIATGKIGSLPFLKYFSPWKPLLFWGLMLITLILLVTHGLAIYVGFIRGLPVGRLDLTFLIVAVGTPYLLVIGFGLYSLMRFLFHVMLLGSSIAYLQFLPARRAYVVGSFLLGITITLTLFIGLPTRFTHDGLGMKGVFVFV
ncbi:MAG: hypothetical protein KC917_21740, partial [Candidatus Omnitrophica bacterium]|nr:hypothetical protein [Candidatus Omnitrophota bacterium]